MRKRLIPLLLCLFFAGAASYGGGTSEPAGGPKKLRAGIVQAVDNNFYNNSLTFAEYIKEGSQGAIIIEVYPAGQLGEERDITASLTEGSIDFCINANGELAKRIPEYGICDAPYIFANVEHMQKVVMGDLFKPVHERLRKEFGIRILGSLYVGIRHVVTNNKQVRTPADLKGMKIRVPDQQPSIDAFKMLGANPTPIPFGELYLALQQGIVDAAENSYSNIIGPKVYEVTQYLCLTGHIMQNNYLTISEKTFQTLTAEQQKLMVEQGERICREGTEQMIDLERGELYQRLLGYGMIPVEADVEAFSKLAKTNLNGSGFDAALYTKIQAYK
ncbi:MAG: DctP family TRAP transporter solute-binding subunit [Spirochaetales bacterium]|jgi:tripartite ATP-independent transporter DctP family solute receptor|nr:DctP family TRAP transporter solute-binding subunit [Spirochaetales bacterium]